MSQPAIDLSSIEPSDDLYLGPAEVVGVVGGRPRVRTPQGDEVVAEMALAFPYNFARGDTLLVIGRPTGHYVIGVLKAQGEVALRFQGDVSLHAVGGKLRLLGDENITMRTKALDVVSDKVRTVADTVIDKVSTLVQNVREVASLRAGQKHEVIQGEWHTRADRATVVTKGTTTINGKQVHLN